MAYVEEKLDAREISFVSLDQRAEEKKPSDIQHNEAVQSVKVSCASSETTAQSGKLALFIYYHPLR